MTLVPYDPDKLDDLARRLLDLTYAFHDLARRLRNDQVDELSLQDRKAMEWLRRFESWANGTVQQVDMAVSESRHKRGTEELAKRSFG